MIHRVRISEDIAVSVYEMGGAFIGDKPAIEKVLNYLESFCRDQAIALCNEPAELNVSKEFDRGYVKGLIEVTEFIRSARVKGRELRFRGRKKEEGSVTNKLV